MGGFNEFQGHRLNEGQIWGFYKHFMYKNFVMNFKISGSVGFAGWICNLDLGLRIPFFLESKNIAFFTWTYKAMENHISVSISNFMIFFPEITKIWRF